MNDIEAFTNYAPSLQTFGQANLADLAIAPLTYSDNHLKYDASPVSGIPVQAIYLSDSLAYCYFVGIEVIEESSLFLDSFIDYVDLVNVNNFIDIASFQTENNLISSFIGTSTFAIKLNIKESIQINSSPLYMLVLTLRQSTDFCKREYFSWFSSDLLVNAEGANYVSESYFFNNPNTFSGFINSTSSGDFGFYSYTPSLVNTIKRTAYAHQVENRYLTVGKANVNLYKTTDINKSINFHSLRITNNLEAPINIFALFGLPVNGVLNIVNKGSCFYTNFNAKNYDSPKPCLFKNITRDVSGKTKSILINHPTNSVKKIQIFPNFYV